MGAPEPKLVADGRSVYSKVTVNTKFMQKKFSGFLFEKADVTH